MSEFYIDLKDDFPYFVVLKTHHLTSEAITIRKEYSKQGYYNFSFGYTDPERKFRSSPIKLKHIILNRFTHKKDDETNRNILLIPVTICDSKGSSREMIIKHHDPLNFYIPNHLSKLSYLNHFIETFDNVEEIDQDKFEKLFRERLHFHLAHPVVDAISNLKVDAYENSSNGKYPEFWNDIEITNYPKDPYLKAEFTRILSERFNGNSYANGRSGLWESSNIAYYSSFPRTKIESDHYSVKVKVILAFELGKVYDENTRISYMIRK